MPHLKFLQNQDFMKLSSTVPTLGTIPTSRGRLYKSAPLHEKLIASPRQYVYSGMPRKPLTATATGGDRQPCDVVHPPPLARYRRYSSAESETPTDTRRYSSLEWLEFRVVLIAVAQYDFIIKLILKNTNFHSWPICCTFLCLKICIIEKNIFYHV